MERELEVVARRKTELETRYADFRNRGLPTEKLEAEARQLLAYETHIRNSATPAAEGAVAVAESVATILCCNCGVLTEVNDARLCLDCLEEQAGIVDGICEVSAVNFCKSCERYEHKPQWLRCEWESKELLALCLKRIRKPRELRLVGAEFVWTEPHSRRIKVQLTVEGEVEKNVTLRQSKQVTFVVAHKQCEECCKSVTPHIWVANVQVRQRSEFKRSMLFLEQLVLKHQAHKHTTNVVDIPDGLDFHFLKPQHAQTLVQFIKTHLCCKVFPIATQLVSHDANSNVYRNKYTQIIELCPVNREDLVYVPRKLSQQHLGGVAPLLLCDRVASGIRLLDPFTLQVVDLDADKYFRLAGLTSISGAGSGSTGGYAVASAPDGALRTVLSSAARHQHEFVVLDAQPVHRNVVGRVADRLELAEVELCRCSDFGKNERYIRTVTHLGGHLKAGDIVVGYDLTTTNFPDSDQDLNRALETLPYEVIVVRKQSAKRRHEWEFKTLPREHGALAIPEGDRAAIELDIDEVAQSLQTLQVAG